MAEYLIQDTTLDAIADAINAKTGGSSAMTPAQMVTAIGSISGGGWELIAEATTTEDVEAFRVDIPAAKQNMAAYLVKYDCVLLKGTATNNGLYPCPRFNSISRGSPYLPNTDYTGYFTISKNTSGYKMLVTNDTFPIRSSSAEASVQYAAFVGYYEGNLVAAGSNIKVYGIGEPT